VAATKQIVRGYLDFFQRYGKVGPQMGTGMNAINALLDQQFTGDINIFPGYGLSSLGKLLKMMSEEEMRDLIKAGERATWPKVPVISLTTRIGRTLDGILHSFERDEAYWSRTAPKKKASRNTTTQRKANRHDPAKKQSRKPVTAAMKQKPQRKSAA
jgi:TAG lipase/steryl ester hydrolase/phospholipase A2/LPA acyltransferase